MFKKKSSSATEEPVFVSKRGLAPAKKTQRASRVESFATRAYAAKDAWRPNASINNLEQEKKKEVDREISEKDRRKKRRIRLKYLFKLGFGASIVLGAFFIIGLSARRVNFNVDNASGSPYAEDLKKSVSQEVNGGWMSYVRPAFFRYGEIQSSLVESRNEVDKVQLKFNFWKMRTDVSVETNIPLVKWVGADGQATYVNQKGRVFEPPVEFINLFKPLEISGSGIGTVGNANKLGSSDKLTWVVAVIPVLRENGVEPSKVTINGETFKSLEILISGLETRLIFSTDEDPGQSGVAAGRSVKHLLKSRAGGLAGIGYIDVRSPDRVLYR